MKAIIIEILPNETSKKPPPSYTTTITTTNTNPRKAYLFFLFLLFLTLIPLSILNDLQLPLFSSTNIAKKIVKPSCDVFTGRWVYKNDSSFKPYYTNSTCREIYDQLNCMKFGRLDTDFLRWKWKPDDCELPMFDAGLFLEFMRNKSMAFVGDSVGRNQMQSLICLLSSVTYPVDESDKYTADVVNNRRWFYTEYNFTLAMLWAPYLVNIRDGPPPGHISPLANIMQLDMDRASESWTTRIKEFDYIIISAGQWFFRPLIFYFNDTPVSCNLCQIENITIENTFYGYKTAFRTAFKAILGTEGYKGVTILRTFSPAHFENGEWDKGGNCPRTKPFADDEGSHLEGYVLEMYKSQVKEFREVEEIGKVKGLVFRLLDTTSVMVMRPDGHPNYYGGTGSKKSVADCVHWCLPGPVDTWNEFLQEMIVKDGETSLSLDDENNLI